MSGGSFASLPVASKAERPGVHAMIRQEIDSAYATVFAPIFPTVGPVSQEGSTPHSDFDVHVPRPVAERTGNASAHLRMKPGQNVSLTACAEGQCEKNSIKYLTVY